MKLPERWYIRFLWLHKWVDQIYDVKSRWERWGEREDFGKLINFPSLILAVILQEQMLSFFQLIKITLARLTTTIIYLTNIILYNSTHSQINNTIRFPDLTFRNHWNIKIELNSRGVTVIYMRNSNVVLEEESSDNYYLSI